MASSLAQEIQFFTAVFNGMPEPVLVADDDRRYVAGNAAACSILGIPRDELTKFRIDDFSATVPREVIEQLWRSFLEQGEQSGEYDLIPPDGKVRRVEYRAKANFLPGFHVSCLRDVTVQRQRETENEERFRLTFEQAAVGMAHVNPDGRLIRVNTKLCEFLGYSQNELLGLNFRDLTHPDDIERDLHGINVVLAGRTDLYSADMRYRQKAGQYVWGHASMSSLRDTNQAAKYFIVVVEDIQKRKHAEDELKRSHAELESEVENRSEALRLLSQRLLRAQDEERRKIARELHDSLGQSLTLIKINAGLLTDSEGRVKTKVLEEIRNIADACLTETRTMSYLLHPPLLDEMGLLSATQWFVGGFSERTGIKVRCVLPKTLPRMTRLLETALYRILQETLTNIHRHSGSSSAEVHLSLEGDRIRLAVKDFGRGISSQILDGFRKGGGGGVGMAGIRERVRELDGRLEIFSEEGKTIVSVTFPVNPFERDRISRTVEETITSISESLTQRRPVT